MWSVQENRLKILNISTSARTFLRPRKVYVRPWTTRAGGRSGERSAGGLVTHPQQTSPQTRQKSSRGWRNAYSVALIINRTFHKLFWNLVSTFNVSFPKLSPALGRWRYGWWFRPEHCQVLFDTKWSHTLVHHCC